ncbi:MAG TPA: hypothetical protein VFG28_05270 [Syntrophales bacterium]|nr:hypothetical protein [Syntrophales bacterium]
MSLNGKKKTDENKTYAVTLIVYGLILAGVIYFYQDALITVTAFVILGVLLFQYLVPQIRDKKKGKADTADPS